jgi:hypothetical protein
MLTYSILGQVNQWKDENFPAEYNCKEQVISLASAPLALSQNF